MSEQDKMEAAAEGLKDLLCCKSHIAAFKSDPKLYGKLAGALNFAIGVLRPIATGRDGGTTVA